MMSQPFQKEQETFLKQQEGQNINQQQQKQKSDEQLKTTESNSQQDILPYQARQQQPNEPLEDANQSLQQQESCIPSQDSKTIKVLCIILIVVLVLNLIGMVMILAHNSIGGGQHSGLAHSLIKDGSHQENSLSKHPGSSKKSKALKAKKKKTKTKSKTKSKTNNKSTNTSKPTNKTHPFQQQQQHKNQSIQHPYNPTDNSSIHQNLQADISPNYDWAYYQRWRKYVDLDKYQPKAGITKEKFQQALNRLCLSHFFQPWDENSTWYPRPSPEKMQEDWKSCSKIRLEQTKQFSQRYDTNQPSSPIKNQSFCIIFTPKYQTRPLPMFRALQSLYSIIMQSYNRYKIYYTGLFTYSYKKQFKQIFNVEFPYDQGVDPTMTEAKYYGTRTETVYRAVHDKCKDGQIVLLVEEGDVLVGARVLQTLNREYQKEVDGETPLMVYSQNIIYSPLNASFEVGNSNFYHQQFFQTNSFRKLRKLHVAPLVSFRKQLFARIHQKDLKASNDMFYSQAFSEALFYPLLEMAGSRILYLEEIMYEVFEMRNEKEMKQDFEYYEQEVLEFYYEKTPYSKISNIALTEEQLKDIESEYVRDKQAHQQFIKQLKQHQKYKAQFRKQTQSLQSSSTNQQNQTSNHQLSHNLYSFNVSLDQMINEGKETFIYDERKNITQQQFELATKRLWLNHHFDFAGEKVEDLAYGKFDWKEGNKDKVELTLDEIKQIAQEQKRYFFEKYNLSSYHSKENQLPICIVIPSYQNFITRLLYRNLDSIFMQNYTNYHVVYVDDHSTDGTGQKVIQYLRQRQIPSQKIAVVTNDEQKGAMYGIYTAITDYCKDGEIVVMVDGDDALVGRYALTVVNAVFQRQKVALMYSQYIQVTDNSIVSVGNCRPFQPVYFENNSFRQVQDARASHLKAFYSELFKKIAIQDLTYDGKRFFQAASDTAMLKPMLEMANPRIKYLPEILYEYRYDTGINGNFVHKPEQKYLKNLIENKPKYHPFAQFNFIK